MKTIYFFISALVSAVIVLLIYWIFCDSIFWGVIALIAGLGWLIMEWEDLSLWELLIQIICLRVLCWIWLFVYWCFEKTFFFVADSQNITNPGNPLGWFFLILIAGAALYFLAYKTVKQIKILRANAIEKQTSLLKYLMKRHKTMLLNLAYVLVVALFVYGGIKIFS